MSYQIGDKVRIVSSFSASCNANDRGYMDKYLGTVMTIIRTMDYNRYRMAEDQDDKPEGWVWNEHCIECKVGTVETKRMLVKGEWDNRLYVHESVDGSVPYGFTKVE